MGTGGRQAARTVLFALSTNRVSSLTSSIRPGTSPSRGLGLNSPGTRPCACRVSRQAERLYALDAGARKTRPRTRPIAGVGSVDRRLYRLVRITRRVYASRHGARGDATRRVPARSGVGGRYMSRRSVICTALVAAVPALALTLSPNSPNADTPQCETYFAAAADAGSPESIAELYRLEALCRRSRAADAPVQNDYCDCPEGSHCAADGNFCISDVDQNE